MSNANDVEECLNVEMNEHGRGKGFFKLFWRQAVCPSVSPGPGTGSVVWSRLAFVVFHLTVGQLEIWQNWDTTSAIKRHYAELSYQQKLVAPVSSQYVGGMNLLQCSSVENEQKVG